MKQKTRIYIDTSVWNFVLEAVRPDSILTYEFLQLMQSTEYIAVISDITETEINKSQEPRRSQLDQLIDIHQPEIIYVNEEVRNLSNIYLEEKLIPQPQINDATHIAAATVNRCDFLVSWNFKHIVRAKVIRGVHLINLREEYGLIELVSPREFLGK